MIWRRLGLVFQPCGDHPALVTHAALPVAAALERDLVRVFYSGRDAINRSAIGTFVLRLGENPKVEERQVQPVLAPGPTGAFDDAGLGMGSIVAHSEGDRLYYMGWNVGGSVPWRNAIGLALGSIRTGRFERFSLGPIMDRDVVDPFSLSYPCVRRLSEGDWRMWYGTHRSWGGSKADMSHAIRCAASSDGMAWRRAPDVAIEPEGEDIAVVRPSVEIQGLGGTMWFARRGSGPYSLACAVSSDLSHWHRCDGPHFQPGRSEWEGGAMTYPDVFTAAGRRWMLYNGSGYGAAGVGLAVWDE